MNEYEKKQEARKQRLQDRAEKTTQEAQQFLGEAKRRASFIPFGQPVLVGHHSEGKDRRYRDGIHRLHVRGVALHEKAEDIARKAEAVGTGGISSDDPDAILKLKSQLKSAVEAQEHMKSANKLIRKHKTDEDRVAALIEIGFSEVEASKLVKGDFCGRVGFPSYALQNNNANARRIELRIKELEKLAEKQFVEVAASNYTYREVPEDNRIWFIFPSKPDAETRAIMKSYAFKWSPSREGQPYVRQLTNAGLYAAREVKKKLDALG